MRIYRQIIKTRKAVVHGLAALAFCMVLGIGTVCFAEEPGTVVVQSAKIRASADAGSEQLGSVQQGGTVSIVSETTGTDGKTWYEVYVDANTKGYIRADLVKKNSGESADSTATTTSTSLPATQANAIDPKSGTVITNNVRIRQGASTEYGVVATANRGMVVTVNGEATGGDGKNWYQISFTYNNKEITGFIRADLVTFDEVPADAAETQIEGESTDTSENEPQTENETAAETVTEEQPASEQPAEQQQQTGTSGQMILMNVDDTPYIMPGFSPIILKWEGQDINAFKNGDFFIFYAQSQSGDEGWYVFDSVNNVYQKYVYAQANVTIPEDNENSGNIVPIIILVIIIIILVLVIGLMFVKQHDGMLGFGHEDDEFDDSEDDEDDIEDIDELDEEEEKQPMRRETRPSGNGQHRRPQNQQQVKRPVERKVNGREDNNVDSQPRRYSEPGRQPHGNINGNVGRNDGTMPRRRPQGQQPVRRTNPEAVSDGENMNTPRRREESPQGETRRPQGQPQAKRPAPQQRPNRKPQQSPKLQQRPKTTAEQDDDDMDFIDI